MKAIWIELANIQFFVLVTTLLEYIYQYCTSPASFLHKTRSNIPHFETIPIEQLALYWVQ